MCSGSVGSVIDWLSSSIIRLTGSTHQLFSANRLSASGGAFGVRVRAPDVEINILGRRGSDTHLHISVFVGTFIDVVLEAAPQPGPNKQIPDQIKTR